MKKIKKSKKRKRSRLSQRQRNQKRQIKLRIITCNSKIKRNGPFTPPPSASRSTRISRFYSNARVTSGASTRCPTSYSTTCRSKFTPRNNKGRTTMEGGSKSLLSSSTSRRALAASHRRMRQRWQCYIWGKTLKISIRRLRV
jgi:hypothetical protein